MANNVEKKFHWRSFTSFMLTLSGLIILLTGIVLYIAPAGRVAHWSTWTLLFLTKSEWQAVHTIFSFTFAILGIFHLYFNWKIFINYIHSKALKSLNKKYEMIGSLIFTLVLFIFVVGQVQPVQSIMDFGEYLTESWENEKTEPPVPHAEQLTFAELSKTIDVPIEKINQILIAEKITISDSSKTILEIAEAHDISPSNIFLKIKPEIRAIQKPTSESTVPVSGSGFGRKTLKEICEEYGLSLKEVQKKLEEKYITASPDDKLKDIAEDHGINPIDLFNIIHKSKETNE